MEPSRARMVWRYTKAVGLQVIYIGVVVVVFSGIGSPSTRLIVAILGLVYAAVRMAAVGQIMYQQPLWARVFENFDEVRLLLDPGHPVDREGFAAAYRSISRSRTLMFIDIGGLCLVALYCVVQLWLAVSAYPAP